MEEWLKLHTDLLHDPKMKRLSKIPEARWMWTGLLLLSRRLGMDGKIAISESIPYEKEEIAEELGVNSEDFDKFLKMAEKLQMVEMADSGIISIVNWGKRQFSESYERMRKMRDKKRNCNAPVTEVLRECYAPVTQMLRQETETELETELETETELVSPKILQTANPSGATAPEPPERDKKHKKDELLKPEKFALFWKPYPRKVEKLSAERQWNARLREKENEDEIILAAENYRRICHDDQREEKFIKHPSTFLGRDKPYKEFLKLPTSSPRSGGNGSGGKPQPPPIYNMAEFEAWEETQEGRC